MNGLDEFAHDTTWNPVTKYVSSVYAGLGADAPAWHGTYRENEDPELIAHFVIEGEPETKSRPRFSRYGRHVYTPERTANAEAHIAARFRQSRPGYLPRTVGNYGVAVVFFCATRQRRDVDNMLKLILDGLNGIAWVDDVQVSEVTGRVVRWAEEPRTDVIIYRTPTQGPPLRPCEQCGKPHNDHGWIDTLEQGHRVCPGDWIITGVNGERYPCKPDVFASTYEPA